MVDLRLNFYQTALNSDFGVRKAHRMASSAELELPTTFVGQRGGGR